MHTASSFAEVAITGRGWSSRRWRRRFECNMLHVQRSSERTPTRRKLSIGSGCRKRREATRELPPLGTRLSFTLNSSLYCRDGDDTGRGNRLGPASVELLQQPAPCAAWTRSSDEYADHDDHADDDAATTRHAARAAECRDAVSSEPRLTQAVAPFKDSLTRSIPRQLSSDTRLASVLRLDLLGRVRLRLVRLCSSRDG